MKAELKIKNFGPIKKADLDLRQTTVFIGPQASGKSTIAKLIALFKSKRPFEKRLDKLNIDLNFYGKSLKNFALDIYISNKNEVFYSENGLTCEWKGQLETKLELKDKITKSIYIPSERIFTSMIAGLVANLVTNEVPIPLTVLKFVAEFEKARAKIKQLNIDFLEIRYEYANNENRIYFDNESKTFLKLVNSSSGQQNVVPMLLILENNFNKPTTFIIEEPELNLYPSAQKALTYHLINRCTRISKKKKMCNELIITTHSPYILTALNNLLFAHKVAQRHPDREIEIKKLIPKECWINPDDFNAYFVANGTVDQIFNRETGMISENELDSGSDDILDDFDALMEIYKLPTHA